MASYARDRLRGMSHAEREPNGLTTVRLTSALGYNSMRGFPTSAMSIFANEAQTHAILSSTALPVRPLPSTTTIPTITTITTTSTADKDQSNIYSTHMRIFAVIICSECLYLEFPGCEMIYCML